MTIKIVTDSSSDIPPQILKELGITVVPLYVRFGNEVFKDKVDISNEEFYKRLVNNNIFPNTSQPSPMDFKQVYEELAKDADGIVSLHLSAKLSGTIQSAQQARETMNVSCPVEIIDTQSISMGEGMVCLAAARAAHAGANMEKTVQAAREAIPEIHFMVLFDSLKYLAMGGRIGQAKNLLGSLLNIKPLIGMKDGEVIPISKARSYSKGLEQQYDFMVRALEDGEIKELAIMYNTKPEEANALANRIAPLYPREKIIMGEIGPILGTHSGPNLTLICIRGRISKSLSE
jgi:DegV family protein with EDD domain